MQVSAILRDCLTGGFRGPAWFFSMLELGFLQKMAHGIHEQMLKKSLRFQDFFFILGLVAQRLMVQARQESPPVCIVL